MEGCLKGYRDHNMYSRMLLSSEIHVTGYPLIHRKSVLVINVNSSFLFTMPTNLNGLFGLCFIFPPYHTANTKLDNDDIDVQFTKQVKAFSDKERLVQHTYPSNQCKHAGAISSCRLRTAVGRRGREAHTQNISWLEFRWAHCLEGQCRSRFAFSLH